MYNNKSLTRKYICKTNINKHWQKKHTMKIGMLLEGLLNVQPFQFFSLLTLLRNSITIKKQNQFDSKAGTRRS